MPIATNKIVDVFPFPTILPIIGAPNYKTIAKVHLKLNSNAAYVQSNLGCGTLGLLQLTAPPRRVSNALGHVLHRSGQTRHLAHHFIGCDGHGALGSND